MNRKNVFFLLTALACALFAVPVFADELLTAGTKLNAAAFFSEPAGAQWTSSDPAVASVDAKGTVTAKKPGTATITFTPAGSSAGQTLAVEVVQPVKQLKLDAASKELLLSGGGAAAGSALNATLLPEDAYYREILWSSSDESIVTVGPDGTLYAVAPGRATVTAAPAEPGSKVSAKCAVTVRQGVTELTLAAETPIVYTGARLKLTATVLPENAANKKLLWTSSDPAVASVDGNGTVTGRSVGFATVTAAVADGTGVTAQFGIEVRAKVKSLKPETTALTLLTGAGENLSTKTLQCQTVPADAELQGIIFTSSDESVVTVSADGTLYAVAPGKAVITMVSEDPACKTSVKCTVTVGSAVTSLKLSGPPLKTAAGVSKKAGAVLQPADAFNKTLEWTSGDPSVATVDKNGNVRGVAPGTAAITCRTTDGTDLSASFTIEVYRPLSSIRPVKSSFSLRKGETAQGEIVFLPEDAAMQRVFWTSSNPIVASVDATTGLITAHRPGTARITATAADGSWKKTSITVSVKR